MDFVLLSLKVFTAGANVLDCQLAGIRHSTKDFLTTKVAKDTKAGSNLKKIFSAFVLFVRFVVISIFVLVAARCAGSFVVSLLLSFDSISLRLGRAASLW